MTRKEQIISKAIEIIKNEPNGIRYSELTRKLKEIFPNFPIETIRGSIWNLDVTKPNEICKPVRGLFQYIPFREVLIKERGKGVEEVSIKKTIKGGLKKVRKEIKEIEGLHEENFYKPFTDWLTNELEECTKAIPLGRNKFKDKWGTPDVIGIRESKRGDIIKLPAEIISAEIKADTRDLITAFGQACAYKLFSHKSYLVVPKESLEEDKAKIDSLCLIFGIGLVFFNSMNPENPNFEVRVRASKHEPDMFYVNKYIKLIEDELF